MRIAMGVEYDGTSYMGWQRQHHGPSVQAALETAVCGVANEKVEVVCAGRTDAGVHALGQVVHFDTEAKREPRGWLRGTNSLLPADVSVSWVRDVPDRFHARFSAVSRRYVYLILNRKLRSALCRDRAYLVNQPLDLDAMRAAAGALVGEHDFSAFRAAGCQSKTPVREVSLLELGRIGDWVVIDIRANAFLQHMVRNITGLLVSVGCGDLPAAATGSILAARNRKAAPFAAPAAGLLLVSIAYPDAFGLPADPALDSLPLPMRFVS